jgi:putative ATP-binding protein
MPAVLKDALERAYIVSGWNLETSVCRYKEVIGSPLFPSFLDVLSQINEVMDNSAYSNESKSDYKGALCTRVKSLTNGLYGQIFTSDELSSEELFDKNVIVDLSRTGSSETKALIMGILVMKLQEYRLANAASVNATLKHVTVLEEAHNILKHTSGTQGMEGANVQGKSVEMLANSIAEMRTYGEGFIIVDQSPNAIDISAIRNTNTKIIMRLPEESDRQQAGKSAAMSDKQIPELARLSKGIAVVYQNNWLEPVLCKINKANITEETFVYRSVDTESLKKDVRRMLAMLFLGNRVSETWDISPDFIRKNMDLINLSTENKILITDAIEKLENNLSPSVFYEDSFEKLSEVVCEIVLYDNFKNTLLSIEEVNGVQEQVHNGLKAVTGEISTEFELAVTQCIMRKMVKENRKKIQLYSKWRKYAVERLKEVQQCQ